MAVRPAGCARGMVWKHAGFRLLHEAITGREEDDAYRLEIAPVTP